MRKSILFLIVMTCLSGSAYAQSHSKLKFFAGSGVMLPIHADYYDNFSGADNSGFNFNAGIGYSFSSIFTVMAEFEHSRLPYDKSVFSSFAEGREAQIFENSNLKSSNGVVGSVRVTVLPKRRFALPYLKLGAGAFRLTETDGYLLIAPNGSQTQYSTSYSSWGPVLAVGGGFKFRLSRDVNLIAETNYTAWFDANGVSPVQFLPIKIGFEF